MAKKKKEEGIILNKATESPVDVIIKDREKIHDDLNVKTVEAESKTHLEDDKGQGEPLTLRTFTFMINPEKTKELRDKRIPFPTPQELFNAHSKQIQIELWKDEWQPIPEIEPRVIFAKDFSHFLIIIGAKPAKGSQLSYRETPLTLSDLVKPHGVNSTDSQ